VDIAWSDLASMAGDEHDAGGHFPAMEVPDLYVGDLRASFAGLTTAS
jgi:hypothetical protein